MKMTPTKIAEIKRKKEAREKGRPGRQKINTQLNPESFKIGPQKPTETPRLKRPIPKKIIEDSKRRKEGYSYGVRTGKDGQPIKTRIKRMEPIKNKKRPKMMGGGMMQMPRPMYGKGGGVCKRGMNRQAIGKNS